MIALGLVREAAKPGKATVLAINLPSAALAALSKGAPESASLTITTSNANRSATFTPTVRYLDEM